MPLIAESYLEQEKVWPQEGRHILAQFDQETVIVYQAYRPTTGHFAAEHKSFGKDFSYSRMSWVKPNFLWMMYRSGWGTKENQEGESGGHACFENQPGVFRLTACGCCAIVLGSS